MTIKNRIPEKFYRLFNSKYMDYYQLILIALYEESAHSYSILGLTEEECRDIIDEKINIFTVEFGEEDYEDEGELLTKYNMSAVMLRRLEEWGWIRKDYDQEMNENVISFPDYSRIFIDVFEKVHSKDSSKERESILSLYSHLFTYRLDKDRNNDILKGALETAKSLSQMLLNMQDGMRGYFEQLTKKRTFLGIQELLIHEINNTDSKKYAILTTSDSFYRYKEEVKELIEKIFSELGTKKQGLIDNKEELIETTISWHQNERGIKYCEDAMDILYKLEREFSGIEKRYNKLIEQKRIFANRAAARIRFVLTEGDSKEDQTKLLIHLLNKSRRGDEILEEMGKRFHMTQKAKVIKEKSFVKTKETGKKEFDPVMIEKVQSSQPLLDDFVVKPLYSGTEIMNFKKKNQSEGIFKVTKDTVKDIYDLEKLLFVWQEATEITNKNNTIEIGEEMENEAGMKYSAFSIRESNI